MESSRVEVVVFIVSFFTLLTSELIDSDCELSSMISFFTSIDIEGDSDGTGVVDVRSGTGVVDGEDDGIPLGEIISFLSVRFGGAMPIVISVGVLIGSGRVAVTAGLTSVNVGMSTVGAAGVTAGVDG